MIGLTGLKAMCVAMLFFLRVTKGKRVRMLSLSLLLLAAFLLANRFVLIQIQIEDVHLARRFN